jgi:Na+-transporting NADH:ubiquinone oxidoreductase subunit C
MSDKAPKSFNRDSMSNTLIVAIGVSLVCSILVASAAIILKPLQQKNEEEYRQRIILDVAGLYEPDANIAELYTAIEESSTTLASGEEAPIYLVRKDGELEQVILPVEGAGLWATMYGFLAAQWKGKRLYADDGSPLIEVVKGPAPEGSDYQIDGLAGATLTGRGVSVFVRHWIGDEGYGPYLKDLQEKSL